MTDRDDTKRILEEWTARLIDELGLTGATIDIDEILRLAGVAAHAVIRPAAPVTTYIVGYAAGLAAAGTDAGSPAAGADAALSATGADPAAPAADADAASLAPRTDLVARAEALARGFADRES